METVEAKKPSQYAWLMYPCAMAFIGAYLTQMPGTSAFWLVAAGGFIGWAALIALVKVLIPKPPSNA